MTIRREPITLTTNSSGGGTANTVRPIQGEILEVLYAGTAWGGTADYTLTRAETGGTILQLTNAPGPWYHHPRAQVSTITGTTMPGTAIARIGSDEYVQLAVLQTPALTAGTVHIIYRGH